MRCNIYEDQFQSAELFGKPVLYTENQIQREAVPEGWFCYDLCGSERQPDQPVWLMDHTSWMRVGTVLSPSPLKRASTQERRVKDLLLSGEMTRLQDFCREHELPCPQDPRKYILRAASKEETDRFYSSMEPEWDATEGTVGHLRMDFGGGWLHHSWWPHNGDRFNTPEFKAALQEFMDEMRVRGPLQSEATMHHWCYSYPEGEIGWESIGFVAETEDYRFCLRCTTDPSDYSYVYCYDLNQQRLAMAEETPAKGMEMGGM